MTRTKNPPFLERGELSLSRGTHSSCCQGASNWPWQCGHVFEGLGSRHKKLKWLALMHAAPLSSQILPLPIQENVHSS